MTRVGLVGAGAFGAQIAATLAELRGVQLAAVADSDAERGRAFAAQYRIPGVFGDAQALAAAEGVDAVIVATPETMHLAPALAALDAGKPVLVEKPMAHTAAAAREIVKKARARGLLLMPGHVVRFEERCQSAKARLKEAGRVRAIRCFQHRLKSAYAVYSRAHTALVVMLHHIDLCRWFAGSEVARVDAREGYFLGAGCPSLVWATLEFQNGTVATLQSGYTLEHDALSSTEDGVEIVTEQERIRIAFTDEGYAARTRDGLVRPDLSYGPALRRELEYWLACIETKSPPKIVTPEDGVAAVALAERIIEAGRSHRVE